jgi:uncharacterized protein YjbJ (UPF0337 family)
MPNKDELQGRVDQIKGNVKQGVGELTGDQRLRDEGAADEAAGEVRETVGTAKRKVADTVRKIGDRIEE